MVRKSIVRLDGALDDIQKIRDTPIVAGGHVLKLSDIAEVERGYEDPATFLVRHNGRSALVLDVVMQVGWNGLQLGTALQDAEKTLNADLPLGVHLTKITDQTDNIQRSCRGIHGEILHGPRGGHAGLPLSLGWRVGIVVAAAVPLTLATVLVVLLVTGRFFDRVTLGALIIALGLLVDDAIIAIEMMVVKLEEGSIALPPRLMPGRIRRRRCWRHAGDDHRLHAGWIREVERRRICWEHILGRRLCADHFVARCRYFHPLSWRRTSAEHQESRGCSRANLFDAKL